MKLGFGFHGLTEHRGQGTMPKAHYCKRSPHKVGPAGYTVTLRMNFRETNAAEELKGKLAVLTLGCECRKNNLS